jgi:hypothetical protein
MASSVKLKVYKGCVLCTGCVSEKVGIYQKGKKKKKYIFSWEVVYNGQGVKAKILKTRPWCIHFYSIVAYNTLNYVIPQML